MSYMKPVVEGYINNGKDLILCVDTHYFNRCRQPHCVCGAEYYSGYLNILLTVSLPYNVNKCRAFSFLSSRMV